jgi:rare lipoprotein A
MNSGWKWLMAAWLTAGLAGCGSTPAVGSKQSAPVTTAARGGYYLDDGPGANPPPNLDAIADAEPRSEPLHRYANRAYVALGNTYVPDTGLKPYREEGRASWYGRRFHGQKTASGELYDMYGMTAAHRTLPIPSYARVVSLDSGKSVVVRINDRGPFHQDRLIDLSYTAAHKLGLVGTGSGRVRVEGIDPAQNAASGEPLVSGIYIQLGAFSQPDNAQKLLEKVQSRMQDSSSPAHVVLTGSLHRVTLGPYASESAAEAEIERIRERLGLQPVKMMR